MEYRTGDKVTVNAIYVDGNDGDEIDMYISKVGVNQTGQKSYRLSKEPHKGGQEIGVSSWGGFTEDDFIASTCEVKRRIDEGRLAECPFCASLDIGGSCGKVYCCKCGVTVERQGPLKNAIKAWNTRKGVCLDE